MTDIVKRDIMSIRSDRKVKNMEILQLTYFCHAAECENFSSTGEHFKVPTSNISRAIRAIEKDLGVKLFNLTANKISLNEKGKEFYSHVKKALTELHIGALYAKRRNKDTDKHLPTHSYPSNRNVPKRIP